MTSSFRSFIQAFRRRWRWPFKRGLRCDPSCKHCREWRDPSSFIGEIWSKDVQVVVEASKHLAEVIQHESIMSEGTVIQIPLLTKKAKPVHKAPQFPCNLLGLQVEPQRDSQFRTSRNWAKVTCGNCLRSRLKKRDDKRQQYDKRQQEARNLYEGLTDGIAAVKKGHRNES